MLPVVVVCCSADSPGSTDLSSSPPLVIIYAVPPAASRAPPIIPALPIFILAKPDISLGIIFLSKFIANLPTMTPNLTAILPKALPNNKYAANKVGHQSLKNFIILCILP